MRPFHIAFDTLAIAVITASLAAGCVDDRPPGPGTSSTPRLAVCDVEFPELVEERLVLEPPDPRETPSGITVNGIDPRDPRNNCELLNTCTFRGEPEPGWYGTVEHGQLVVGTPSRTPGTDTRTVVDWVGSDVVWDVSPAGAGAWVTIRDREIGPRRFHLCWQ